LSKPSRLLAVACTKILQGENHSMEQKEGVSQDAVETKKDIEEVASIVIEEAFKLHKELGPGLLETVYEAILAKKISAKGLIVERQKSVPIHYQGMTFDEGFRLDLLVDGQLVIELKSVENIHPVHPKQLLTYLRLMNLPLGLLINFGASLLKDGLKRVVNQHNNFASSRLRMHQKGDQK
ncbi:GxxExxY protein, partial [Leptospira kirschneri]|uniref:GxxExxY protein n=1 Tax=Leptospira kirschneri TaxID=29507 RepID=UPI002117A87E